MANGMEAGACSCDFDEYAEMVSERTRRARKEHQCDECEKTIRPGDLYIWAKWFSDGEWSEQKRCVQCQQIGKDFCCGLLGAGEVWDHVLTHLGVNLRTGEVRDD